MGIVMLTAAVASPEPLLTARGCVVTYWPAVQAVAFGCQAPCHISALGLLGAVSL